ncbi:hypothetical protein BDK51DRAFT_33456 [Blyttiomyces helicus]|uniref:Uncharacterized protein n=1 Tax=Blyttiomyces helicus TaxID=388810 RepID=A0A4P9VXB9_9FUNG|nr:hypothetical protein BDK51DRAFT_33456 [Blyttiomyces helicus]|eukprot:RKO83545.1 hypothetical protein BDK51DRAFT_33456 [Blyttiomyces helicus]
MDFTATTYKKLEIVDIDAPSKGECKRPINESKYSEALGQSPKPRPAMYAKSSLSHVTRAKAFPYSRPNQTPLRLPFGNLWAPVQSTSGHTESVPLYLQPQLYPTWTP